MAPGTAWCAARDLRQFVRDVADLPSADREQAILDRRGALADHADRLRRLARTAWRRPLASFGLGIADGAVGSACGSPLPAGPSAAAAIVDLRRQADPASAYALASTWRRRRGHGGPDGGEWVDRGRRR